MINNLKQMSKPEESDWLRYVLSGYPIYLVKEDKFALVEYEYDPRKNKIGLGYDSYYRSWYIDADGKGMDGSQCLLPVEGYLSETPFELNPSIVHDLTEKVNKVNYRLDNISKNFARLQMELEINLMPIEEFKKNIEDIMLKRKSFNLRVNQERLDVIEQYKDLL
jgi:hypothetical protein